MAVFILTACEPPISKKNQELIAQIKKDLNRRTMSWTTDLTFEVIDLRQFDGRIDHLVSVLRQGDLYRTDAPLRYQPDKLITIVRSFAEAYLCLAGVVSVTSVEVKRNILGYEVYNRPSGFISVRCVPS